ncbi:hypothetical protein PENTCL1PPCAC_21664, partial [Pristionchus entomophagus]
SCEFDSEDYSSRLEKRCGEKFDFDEFLYFYNLCKNAIHDDEDLDDSLEFYSTHGNKTNRKMKKSNRKRIDECVFATSRIVEGLYDDVDDVSKEFEAKVNLYTHIQDRMFSMELLSKKNVGLNMI